MSEGTRWALARRRQLALILPVDLQYLQSSGTVVEALRPFFDATQIEGARLTLAYEGEAGTLSHRALSAPRKALLEDYLRAGMVMMGELARYAQTQDPDAGSRAITAMGRRSAILEKLGLENAEHEVPDLSTYLAQRTLESTAQDRARRANGGKPDADSTSAGDRAPVVTEDGELGRQSLPPSSVVALDTDSTKGEHHETDNPNLSETGQPNSSACQPAPQEDRSPALGRRD